ncbi:MAG: 50S ribosomal protein L22 [Planctomycetota bacterium]
MDFVARHRFARISPYKVRPVLDLIRGKPVNEALTILQTSRKRGAIFVHKVLRSAIANAGVDVDVDDLYVVEVCADDGPTLKRGQARARGMWNRILKRTSHIRVAVRPKA